MTTVVTPFDDLFHFTFQHPRHAVAWLGSVLPPALTAAIDWSTLRPAPEKLRGRSLRLAIADVVFDAERSDGTPVRLLLEHKAQRDPGTEEQVLRYAVLLRERGARRGRPVPVVAVLLFHGDRPFATTEGTDDPVAAMQPRLPFAIDDLSRAVEVAIRRRGMSALATLTLLCLRFLRGLTTDAALRALARWGDLLRAADRDAGPPDGHAASAAIACYVLLVVDVPPRTLHVVFERLLQRPEETIMSTVERLRREGRAEGHAEGHAEGLTEGRAALLLHQLTRRFGAVPTGVTERVARATVPQLELWGERVLDARTLEEVFAS